MMKPNRRFVKLNIEEISLVDAPANEQEFAVIKAKNLEVKEMAKAKEEKVEEKIEEGSPEKVETEEKTTDDEKVQKAMDKVVGLVESLVEKAAKKPGKMPTEEVEEEKGCGGGKVKKEEVKKEANEEEEKAASSEEDEEKQKKTPVKKQAEEGSVLDVLFQEISKAKRFTPKRQEALQELSQKLNDLMADIGGEKMETEQTPEEPAEVTEETVQKSVKETEEKVAKSLSGLLEITKNLSTRIEEIEKARQPSKVVQGGTDGKETGVEKGFWGSVFN